MSVQVSEVVSEREERIRMLRAELQGIEDNKLLKSVISLNRKERKLRLRVLLYLREIDRRRLYLELGFPSMFAFCTERLGYSRSAACRRMGAARCIGKYPEAGVMLQNGEVNITSLSLVSGMLTPGNHARIFSRIRNRSRREVEMLISGMKPQKKIRDRVRPVCVLKPSTPTGGSGEKSAQSEEPAPDGGRRLKAGRKKLSSKKGTERLQVERRFEIRFSAAEGFMKKLEKAKSLLSTKYPKGINLELLFDELLDNYLEDNVPERRTDNKPEKNENNRTRHIPQRVKDKVYRRDGGRCTFTGRNGKRCGSRWNLQYDHIVPYGKGGDNSPDNLRLLCGRHNQLMAEREYGREHMSCCRGDDP